MCGLRPPQPTGLAGLMVGAVLEAHFNILVEPFYWVRRQPTRAKAQKMQFSTPVTQVGFVAYYSQSGEKDECLPTRFENTYHDEVLILPPVKTICSLKTSTVTT